MDLSKRFLSLVLSLGVLLGLSVGVYASGLPMKGNFGVSLVVGENTITVTDSSAVSVMEFIPGEAGIFRFVLTGDACMLYSVYGSKFYMYNPQPIENNVMEKEIKESQANSPMLIGVLGNGTATLSIERVGEASFDISAQPFETYKTTATLTKFTKDKAIDEYVFVDVTESHTAVLGVDGYYHLDTAEGPVLYMNFTDATYLPVAAAAANGAMKDVLYDENGNFIKKIEFITCINEYYGYTDNSTNQMVAGYTDGGLYPLTYDLVYILQTHTASYGWSDSSSANYLFTGMTVDVDTAWMFPVCYGLYIGDMNGDSRLTTSDAVHLLYHTMLPESYALNRDGDVNGDGVLDSDDAIYLLYHVLLPEQYPLA
ncbi:MAG: dockerin type I repeat-containing protein [Clostridia bacterium]|nr:dockerin type I repeat-containing protein [Clostridia bacterium]